MTLQSPAYHSAKTDDAVWASIAQEEERQEVQLELIASENHASKEVMAAMGTALTNKYAEGYPGRRYYGGCEFVDEVEDLARNRARELFGSERANVQPHSGTQANMAAFMSMLDPGDKVLAMSLDHGGHLSHGHTKNFSGVFYDFHSYGVEPGTERLDMDKIREQALALRPKLLIAGASAYSRPIDFAAFASIAKEVDALFMVDMAHIAGLVAGGAHESPVPHADVVTLTTHKTLRGPRGGMILCPKERIVKINSALFPGGQGGPLMHVIAAKAIAFREALQPPSRNTRRRWSRMPAFWRTRSAGGRPYRLWRHGQPRDARGCGERGPLRRGGGGRAPPGQHHVQQEPDSLRRASSHGGVRDSPRYRGCHHARAGRIRHGAPRRVDQ